MTSPYTTSFDNTNKYGLKLRQELITYAFDDNGLLIKNTVTRIFFDNGDYTDERTESVLYKKPVGGSND